VLPGDIGHDIRALLPLKVFVFLNDSEKVELLSNLTTMS